MSLTRSLTRPLTRKISRADLTQGFGGSFSPFALNPYLLFDARDSMVGTLENPTLDLNPALPETLDVITATRAGVATYTDADGNIATASDDTVRVDYTQGAELTPTKFQRVVQTDYFSSPNSTENTTLQYVTGPTGQLDAVRVTEDATTDYHYLAMKADVVSGTDYAISFYIKQGTYSTARVFTQSAYMPRNTAVNFSTETASNGIMENVGDGWYRVAFTGTAISTGTMIVYATVTNLNSYAGDVNNFTDYYGFQVEEGTTASSFVANTTGSPKFITGATYGPRVPMILVEPSATNLLAYSEDFSISWWTKGGVSVVSEETSAPDGSSNVFKVVENTSTSGHSVFRNASTVTLNAHSFSVIAKTNGRNLVLDFFGGTNFAKFDLTSGSVISTTGSGLTASIEPIGGGWFRCSITQVQTSTTIYPNILCLDDSNNISYQGDGTSGVYIWGAQLEAGSVATSYIPTSGGDAAARTRAADDLQIERDSTNLVTYSEDFSNSYWNRTEVTVSAAPVAAPNGTMTASHVVKTGSQGHLVKTNIGAANTHTVSIWARTASGTGTCFFNYHGGTPSTVTEEWQRFEVPANTAHMYAVNFRGTSTLTEIYIWGAQLELGDTTSYIPTSGAAASRTDFSDFYNASEGTWYCEAVPKGNDGSENYTFILEYGTANTDRVGFFYYVADGSLSVTGFNSNSQYYNQTKLGDSTNQLARLSYSYESGNHKSAINGTSDSDTDTVVPPANQLKLGKRIVGTNGSLVGHIKRVLFWPYHSDRL